MIEKKSSKPQHDKKKQISTRKKWNVRNYVKNKGKKSF